MDSTMAVLKYFLNHNPLLITIINIHSFMGNASCQPKKSEIPRWFFFFSKWQIFGPEFISNIYFCQKDYVHCNEQAMVLNTF